QHRILELAVTLGLDRIDQRLRRIERLLAGMLLEDAFHRGERTFGDAVTARIGRYGAVGHAQGGVGVGIDRLALRLLPPYHRRHVLRDDLFQVAVDFLAALFQ